MVIADYSLPLSVKGDAGYEMQIMDSYNNPTYVNGQAGSIYKQTAPLVNPVRPPGSWNVYDVIWTAPHFNADSTVKSPARVTAFFNGVLVQNNTEVKGPTLYIGKPSYKMHGPAPVKLQAHGDKANLSVIVIYGYGFVRIKLSAEILLKEVLPDGLLQ